MSTQVATIQKKITSLIDEAYAIRISNLNKSVQLTKDALIQSRQLGFSNLIAKSLSRLSLFYMIKGDFAESLALANEAADLYVILEDEQGVADAKFNIASVHYKTDNLHLGLKYLLDCLIIFTKHNDHFSIAKTNKSLGTIYEYFGDIDSAMEAYQAAIAAADMAGDVNMKSNVYNPLSGMYLNQNNAEKAMDLIEESIAIKTKTGDVRGIAFAFYGRAKIYAKQKKYKLAQADYTKAITIHNEMGEKFGVGLAYLKLAVLLFEQNKVNESKEFATKAYDIGIKYTIRLLKTKYCYLLYGIYKKENNIAKALHFLEIYHAELDNNVNSQTYQIIDSYKMIHKAAAKNLEEKMQLEKTLIIQEKEKAEHIGRAKQDFLSNMSHEIRTPLNAVITITNLLKERADDEDQQLLESLTFASNNLLLLINDVLDFTKLDTNKIQLENRPTNLRELVQNIKNTYDSVAKEKGLLLTLQIDENVGETFELDDIKLSQILGNLISNAIKFTDKGFVKIVVEHIEKSTVGTLLKFKVIDTGSGITTDFLKEIFDSFTQPKSVTTKKHKGSGLGLAIVKKLVNIYDSDVFIDTIVNEGSTFYFSLLLQPAKQPPVSKAITNTQLPHLKVLLAEDNKINMLVALKLLSRWGIKADEAYNGTEAIEKATEKKYDIILMDIHMPDVNGYEATRLLKQTESLNFATPVFAFTADIIANEKQEYENYFSGFLRKPIEVDELYRVLSSLAICD